MNLCPICAGMKALNQVVCSTCDASHRRGFNPAEYVAREFAGEFATITENVRVTAQELVTLLNVRGQHGAATCLAELADAVEAHLKLAALLAEVYAA